MKPKLNSTKYIPFVIVFLVLTMAIGYAVINSVTFDIQGESQAKTQEGIFITEVKKLSSNGSETYKTNLAYQNVLDGRVELDDEANSTISIKVSFYNNSEYDYIFEDITYQDDLEDAYSNKNISYSFDSQGETIKVGNPLVITVTFDYLDSNNITDNILNFILNFKFKPIYEKTFAYTGNYETWTVPFDATYKIELWGAQGGKDEEYKYYNINVDEIVSEKTSNFNGGYGGYTKGNIKLIKDDELYIYVGESGARNLSTTFNGGGAGAIGGTGYTGSLNPEGLPENNGFSGGGATDIRLTKGIWNNFDSLKSRIMVAAGGGGITLESYQTAGSKGYAGGLIGYEGGYYHLHTHNMQNGQPGTQTSGGRAANIHFNASGIIEAGSFGKGGSTTSVSSSIGAGGGGGGYYGGSGASGTLSGGAGNGGGSGSSFISGHNGCNAISETSTKDNIIHTEQSIHYSNYKFTNTVMIDGAGYNWTTSKGSYVGMPTHDGKSTMEGNTGNGYAKITLLEIE